MRRLGVLASGLWSRLGTELEDLSFRLIARSLLLVALKFFLVSVL